MLQHCCCCSPHSTSSKTKFNKHKVLNIPLTNPHSVNIIFHRYSKHHKAEYQCLDIASSSMLLQKTIWKWCTLIVSDATICPCMGERVWAYNIPWSSQFLCVCKLCMLQNIPLLIWIYIKILVPKNSRNNHIIECTKAENASLASKDWIGKLDVPYWCHEFHNQFLKCHYISKPSNEELATIKAYFKDYWSFLERWRLYCKVDKCWRNWHMLWLPFYLSSTWNSQRAEFKFLVGEINYFLNEPWIYKQYRYSHRKLHRKYDCYSGNW